MPLILTDSDVRQCLTISDAIAAIEDMCRAQADGTALLADRAVLPLPNGWLRLLPGALTAAGVFGYKELHLTTLTGTSAPEAHVRYAYHLFDYRSGEPLAMMDADYLTFVRTAAASGAAIRCLARKDAAVAGIIGSGAEARSHIEALAAVRAVKHAKVFSRSAERRARFARETSAQLGVDVQPVDRPEHAIENADVLLVATNTAGVGPALSGQSLRAAAKAGLHINSIGSTSPKQREIDPGVWSFADRIILDTRRLLQESGDAIVAAKEGTLAENKIGELHEIVSGRKPGRTSPSEITIYKSIGTGLQDVAVANYVYRQALARQLGRTMAEFQSVKRVEPN